MFKSSNAEFLPDATLQNELEETDQEASLVESTAKFTTTSTATSTKRRALGRGLGALLSTTETHVPISPGLLNTKTLQETATTDSLTSRTSDPETPPSSSNTTISSVAAPTSQDSSLKSTVLFLDANSVFPNAKQPRKAFPEKELQQLSDSIAQSGLIQPIVVRPKQPIIAGAEQYEIIAGERRYRAAKLAGLTKIPAILKDIGDRECLAISIVENVQRQDLNPIEEALAYQRLIDEFGLTPTEIAKEVGRDRSSIANALRLLKLPDLIQRDMILGKLSAGHGRAILMVESLELQLELAEKIVSAAISVRQAEELARNYLQGSGQPERQTPSPSHRFGAKSPTVLEIEERLRRVLGTKLSINLSPEGKGELRISIFSQDDLQNIMEKLGA